MTRLLATAALALLAAAAAPPARAATPPRNPMHPTFVVVDSTGRPVRVTGRPADAERTCGRCHDAAWIHEHSGHWNDRVRADCAACHWPGGALPRDAGAYQPDGSLVREAIRVRDPEDADCAACHAIVQAGAEPLRVPAGFGSAARADGHDGFTLGTGAVFSGQDLADSWLNLEGKETLRHPWDVHARRLVRCVDCHYAANHPARTDLRARPLDYMVQDPRRIPLATFLHRPDHRLAAADCRSCHDPMKVHDFLPYKQRHLDALACASCHVPRPMGPAARMVDETVVRLDGSPRIVWRGTDADSGAALNTAFATGYAPLLLPGRDADGRQRLRPYNAVDRWFWVSGDSDTPVSSDRVRQAWLEGRRYAPEVLRAFDDDHDGALTGAELAIRDGARQAVIARRLEALGVAQPAVRHVVTFRPLAHGVSAGGAVQRDCATCHAQRSRMGDALALAPYAPGGGAPGAPDALEGGVRPADVRFTSDAGGLRVETRARESANLYVFGSSGRSWAHRTGLLVFALVAIGVLTHTGMRLASRRPSARHAKPMRREYLYRTYERVWHWLMALSIIALMLTGLQIEFAGARAALPLPLAVDVHNFFAIVLTVNAFLSLFYHVTAGAIRQFIPPRDGLAEQVVAQARYYAQGILLGQPHPAPRTAARKLNPLQQLTYLALLNVLFPLQVVTGTLIWGISRWPHVAERVGGLTLVAPLHALGSWLFLAFFALHLYLTTTGHTVFSHVEAMITGYDHVDIDGTVAPGGPHA